MHVSFAAPISAAREVNGQEQPVGSATVEDGKIVTSFTSYQPRTFALRLSLAPIQLSGVKSVPVDLRYTAPVASTDGQKAGGGFDGKGNALPAEMLPSEITFNDVHFRLAPAKTGSPDAVIAKGQSIKLPAGHFNRLYFLAASINGDQQAEFAIGSKAADLHIEDWSGLIGQWDDRQWSFIDSENDRYGEMTGLKPGYIKRADLAWYCDHHHDSSGQNAPYSYSYLFAYKVDLEPDAQTVKLPDNPNIRILALSVAEESPELKPAQPLYDLLVGVAKGR